MSSTQAVTKSLAPETPVQRLSTILKDDMRAVNEQIIKNMDSPVPMIPQLASYLIASGGKRIRPLLTLACTSIYAGEMERSHILAASVEFIHSATLLHDDVVDESNMRRGQETANLIFGNQASVLVGDFLFSRAFQLMVSDGSLDVLRILSDASAIIAQGEVMQLAATGNINTSMEDYITVIKAKTAALFAAACEVGPVIAKSEISDALAMAEYGLNLGIAFQIADDALDYTADQEKLGKDLGNDFREGKLTAPVILSLEKASAEEKEFWLKTMTNQEQDKDDLNRAIEIITRHDGIDRSLELARNYGQKAREALAEAPDHPLRAMLDELVTFTIERHG